MSESKRQEEFRTRMYEAYASTHAGRTDAEISARVYRHDLLPLLPQQREAVIVDIGCGQGALVAWLRDEGYRHSLGVDVSPEQVAMAHANGVGSVILGDFKTLLSPGSVDAVVATDFFEHFDKYELVDALDACRTALRTDGTLVFRVPNALSPFGGNYRHGDLTHESWFTARSVRQLLAATGFEHVLVQPCDPVAHGPVSAARWLLWKGAAGLMKVAIAAETGIPRGHLVTMNMLVAARRR